MSASLPGSEHADVGKAEHAGAVHGRPPHHLLDCGRARAFGRPVGVPGAVHLADHVGELVRGRAVDREGNRAAQCRHPVGWRDPRSEAAIRLRAVGHAGAALDQERDLFLVQVHEMREPYIGAEPVVLRDPVHRALAEFIQAELHIVVGFRQMAVQAQAEAARGGGDDLQFVGLDRPGWCGRREGDAAHAGRRRVHESAGRRP